MTGRFVVDHASGTMDVRCLWCEQPTRPWPERTYQGCVVVCPCGAMVLLAPPRKQHDADVSDPLSALVFRHKAASQFTKSSRV